MYLFGRLLDPAPREGPTSRSSFTLATLLRPRDRFLSDLVRKFHILTKKLHQLKYNLIIPFFCLKYEI